MGFTKPPEAYWNNDLFPFHKRTYFRKTVNFYLLSCSVLFLSKFISKNTLSSKRKEDF